MPLKKPGAVVDTDAIWGTNGTARVGEVSVHAVMPNDRITIDIEHEFQFAPGVGGAEIAIAHDIEIAGVWGTNGVAIQVEKDPGAPAEVSFDDVFDEDPGPGLDGLF